jgi:two-component system, OmpR family, response regulator VicR
MRKILIVEDERALNEAYRLVLEREGYDINTAFDGQEALEKFNNLQPDLVLLDLRMPKLDGVGFLRKLQPKQNHPKVKIIIFSNFDDQKEIDQAFKYGATRYILKAWSSPKELVKIVKDTLALKG